MTEEMKEELLPLPEDAAPLSEEAVSVEALSETASVESMPAATSEEVVNWQERYEKSEARLRDSLTFATLYAPYVKEGEALDASPVYLRYLELCDKGLTAEEAFAASLHRTHLPSSSSKAHLTSGVPSARATVARMSGEEMAIARELLGETHSDRELERLFRRVAKP